MTSSTFLRLPRDPLREALEHAYAMGVDNGVRGGRDYADAGLDRSVEIALTAFDVLGGSR